MKCPKCGFARPLTDQVCRRCKYVFDEDRFLSLAPPRAVGGKEPGKFFARRSWAFLENLRSRVWVPPLASLIPGLGHALQGRYGLGLLYVLLVPLLAWTSVAYFRETTGQMLFGIMISTHATCILDTTPWGRSPRAGPRIAGMSAILLGLLFGYWPIIWRLAEQFVPPQRREAQRGLRVLQALDVDQVVIMIVLFAISLGLSTWMSRKISSRES